MYIPAGQRAAAATVTPSTGLENQLAHMGQLKTTIAQPSTNRPRANCGTTRSRNRRTTRSRNGSARTGNRGPTRNGRRGARRAGRTGTRGAKSVRLLQRILTIQTGGNARSRDGNKRPHGDLIASPSGVLSKCPTGPPSLELWLLAAPCD